MFEELLQNKNRGRLGMRAKKILSCILAMLLLASAVPMAVTPAAAVYEEKISCDADENGELTKDELVNVILPYMLDEGDLKLDDVGDAAWVYAYWDGKPKTITDMLGEDVTIYKPIKRIVTGWVDNAEIVRALGARDKLIGIDRYTAKLTVLFPEISKLPPVGYPFQWGMDYEAVLGVNPDAFYPWMWVDFQESSKRQFEEKLPGVTIICLNTGEPETYVESVRKLGYLLDKEDEAEELIDFYEENINAIKDKTAGLSEDEKPKVYIETGGKRQWGAFRQVCECDAAGGRNIAASLPGPTKWSATVSAEWVADQNPDIIVKTESMYGETNMGYGLDDPSEVKAIREEIMNRDVLAERNAVKKGSVYIIDCGHLQIGPGHVIGIAYYAKWFHPKLFEDLDPAAIHQEYIDRFHHLNFNVSEHGVFVYHPEKYPEGR